MPSTGWLRRTNVTNPIGVHLNGGVNLATTTDVLETVATRLGNHLRRIPDGEVDAEGQAAVAAYEPRRGSRQNWIFFLTAAYDRAAGVEEIAPWKSEAWGDEFPQYRLTGAPEEIDFGDRGLGYADAYLESYREFTRLKRAGTIPEHVRFQAQFPSAIACGFWIRPEDQQAAQPVIARALADEITDFIERTDPDEVAVQLDVAVETGLALGWYGPTVPVAVLSDSIAGTLNTVDLRVPAGVHLCYGDYRHHHGGEVESLELQVRLIHGVSSRTRRPVNWFSVTVPQDETREEFFAPLADLRLRPETEIYFGIVPYHPDRQEPGTTERQIDLIERFIRRAHGASGAHGGPVEWGVCTECGMARVERVDIDPLLDLHANLAEPLSQREGVLA